MKKPLNKFKTGEKGRVIALSCEGALRRRIIDMGITTGADITMRRKAPFGDPMIIIVRGYILGLRRSEAELIMMEAE